ncbi:MAG: DNA recombination protein RmuC [Actinobacteria bacterium]|nr:DNA recombination protein RmuC [Actinomycetota bacterium]
MEIIWLFTGLFMGLALGSGAAALVYRSRLAAASARSAATEQQIEHERELASQKLAYAEEVNARLDERLRAVSGDALRTNSETFLQLASATFDPITQRLDSFDRQLQDFRTSHGSISQHLSSVARETSNLTNALRKPSVRGRWGEISLRNAVEAAGLSAHCDFTEQATVESDEGRRRPDMVVRLPGNRQVVVDSKVPLEAYLEAANTEDEVTRAAKIAEHAAQVRKHVQELAKKSYWEQFDRAPECVVMFLRLEATLAAALEADSGLFEEAARSRVILATPSTLVGVLFAIGQAWRQEAVAENAERISEMGRELYKRLATMGDHFAKLGRGIKSVVGTYNDTVGSLEGRVLATARKFDALGAASGDIDILNPVESAPRPLTSEELVAGDARVFELPAELPAEVAIDDDDYGTLGRAAR